ELRSNARVERLEPRALLVARRPGETRAEAQRDLLLEAFPRAIHAPRESLSRLDIDGIVERHERLERRVRAVAPHGANLSVRRIERDDRRVRVRSAPRRVDRAPVAIRACARLPVDA